MASTGSTTIDFGSTPVSEQTFIITDAGVNTSSLVEVFVVGTTTGDNDADAHNHAAASWRMIATPGSGSFGLNVYCTIDMCHGTFIIKYVYT